MKPVIVVHGGAGRIFKEREEGSRSGVTRAALQGYSILKQGGSALYAVETAVAIMEDDPYFNAGCGSVLNEKGEVEMDAIIMDGKNLASGAVSAVKCIANPIKLSRLVMEKVPYSLLNWTSNSHRRGSQRESCCNYQQFRASSGTVGVPSGG
uniref:Uncharacterized protein n=1 Tax=Sphenodon punctatus TaxID=8508 RepID=A0A8D0HE04_SPHPU